jgi:hypothetical protein
LMPKPFKFMICLKRPNLNIINTEQLMNRTVMPSMLCLPKKREIVNVLNIKNGLNKKTMNLTLLLITIS